MPRSNWSEKKYGTRSYTAAPAQREAQAANLAAD